PHDSYFFREPAEMITGLIRPPVLMLDNPIVVRRHVHSLILENLTTRIPSRLEEMADEEGTFTGTVIDDIRDELADPRLRDRIASSVRRAFHDTAPSALTDAELTDVVGGFSDVVREGLLIWCREYASLVEEIRRVKSKSVVNTKQEMSFLMQIQR